ncbi:hypothetical protein G5V59_27015 [Nocardioides sp. W3-2-3]|nr:hypothetical protein [Nocardioides convexus]
MSPIPMREGVAGVQSLDFDLDVGKRASTAKAVVDAKALLRPPRPPRAARRRRPRQRPVGRLRSQPQGSPAPAPTST